MDTNDFLDDEDSEYSTCDHCEGDSMWTSCWSCGGEGGTDGEDLMSEDPLWYGPEDFRTCDICNGKGGYYVCLNKCQENCKHEGDEKITYGNGQYFKRCADCDEEI